LQFDFPDEAIYRALYVRGRGALRRELWAGLRTGRALRVPNARTRQRGKQFITSELIITVPGHWEGLRSYIQRGYRRPGNRLSSDKLLHA
jgi:hypothetical protein